MTTTTNIPLPFFLQNLLAQRKDIDSAGDIRSREKAISLQLSSSSSNNASEKFFVATIAATIHPRHLWSLMQCPPIGPATTPWVHQEAYKRLIAESQSSSENIPRDETELKLLSSVIEFAIKDLAELRSKFRTSSSSSSTNNNNKNNQHQDAAVPSSSSSTSSFLTKFVADCVEIKSDPNGDGVSGSVILAKPAAPSTTIFKVPGSFLFNALTVAEHSKLGSLLTKEPWKSALDAEDEALLILTLLYEKIEVGVEKSHWSEFLKTCPKHFPHIPLCWNEDDLTALDPSMFSQVVEKGQSIQLFAQQCRALLAQVEQTYPEHFAKGSLVRIVSPETVTWARCVFDSRSFVLNYKSSSSSSSSSKERTTLAPFIDMLNHDCYSDILSRKISSSDDDKNNTIFFEMVSGPTSMENVGDELYLCYGPLETWELLVSYGFVLEGAQDGRNVYDVLPLPISYDAPGEDDNDEKKVVELNDDGEEKGADPLASLRMEVIKKCGLESLQRHGLFVPVSGEMPVALRQILSIWQEQDEAALRKYSSTMMGVKTNEELDQVFSVETLESVNETTRAALTMMLEDNSPHTLEQDLIELKKAKKFSNVYAAVVARLTLKMIAKRGLDLMG